MDGSSPSSTAHRSKGTSNWTLAVSSLSSNGSSYISNEFRLTTFDLSFNDTITTGLTTLTPWANIPSCRAILHVTATFLREARYLTVSLVHFWFYPVGVTLLSNLHHATTTFGGTFLIFSSRFCIFQVDWASKKSPGCLDSFFWMNLNTQVCFQKKMQDNKKYKQLT